MKYPILAREKKTGLVVLFTAPSEGTVLVADRYWGIGTHGTNWTRADTADKWEFVRTATVTIEPPAHSFDITMPGSKEARKV